MVKEAWTLAIEFHNHQRPVADAPAGTPLVCQLPASLTFNTHLHTRDAESVVFCIILFYRLCNIDYTTRYARFNLKMITILG